MSLGGKGGDEDEQVEEEEDEADENVEDDDDDADDTDDRRVPNRSQTPDVNRRKSSDITGERRRTKSAVATPSPTGGRRLSQSSQPQQQQKPDVTFPIGQSAVALQRQKSYGEFKAELFSKLEKAGVPVARRPTSRSGSARGRRKVEGRGGEGGGSVEGGREREEKTSRGMGWRPAGPDYDPDAKVSQRWYQ